MKKFTELNSYDDLELYMEDREYKHTNYFHYSDIKGINGILENKKIWISSMMYSNDAKENDAFGDETYRYFQLCFSTGKSENLPLWFLYSGVNGNGARINFPKKSIKKLLDPSNLKIELVETASDKKIELWPNINCELSFRDILYRQHMEKQCRIIHNCISNFCIEEKALKKYEENYRGFIKDPIWFYEKEARILVKVDANLIDKSLFWKDQDLKNRKEKSPYRIDCQIPEDVYSEMDITLSPKYTIDNASSIINEPGFKGLLTNRIMSEYQGQINIDLCKKCDKK